jgi:chromosome segregation ATPase
MNCPKCGYSQEERLDCVKCGVVFSKYHALFTADSKKSVADSNSQDDQNQLSTLAELRQQIWEMNRRYNEIEFDKAERGRFRADLKNLEQKLQDNSTQITNQLSQLESQLEALANNPEQSQLRTDLKGLEQKVQDNQTQITNQFQQLESKLETLSNNPEQSQLRTDLKGLEQKVQENQTQITNQFQQLESKLETLSNNLEQNPFRTDLANLEQKLHDNQKGISEQLSRYEKQFEDRPSAQAQKHLLDAHLTPILNRLKTLETRFDSFSENSLSEAYQQTLEVLNKLDKRILETENKISDIEKTVEDIKGRTGALQLQFNEYLIKRNGEPKTLKEEDIRAIRDNLDELRNLFSTLGQKS